MPRVVLYIVQACPPGGSCNVAKGRCECVVASTCSTCSTCSTPNQTSWLAGPESWFLSLPQGLHVLVTFIITLSYSISTFRVYWTLLNAACLFDCSGCHQAEFPILLCILPNSRLRRQERCCPAKKYLQRLRRNNSMQLCIICRSLVAFCFYLTVGPVG